MTLALDLPGALLLGAAALLWIVAGAYASAHLRGDRCDPVGRHARNGSFAPTLVS